MTKPSKISELERLKKLKDDGVLSEDEYNRLKYDILYDTDAPKAPTDIEEVATNQQNTVEQTPHTETQQPEKQEEPITIPPKKNDNKLNEKQPKNKFKFKMNSTYIGFAIAVIVVTIGFIIALSFSGKNNKTTDTTIAEASSTSETLPEQEFTSENFFRDISGVWDTANLDIPQIAISYDNNTIQFWVGEDLTPIRLGDIDPENETINIISTAPTDRHENIITLQKKWNQDKTNFTLKISGEVAADYDDVSLYGEYKLVRKISNDDLKRFAKRTAEKQKQVALENQNKAREFAENYSSTEISTNSTSDLAPFYAQEVRYFGKVVTIGNLLKDKNKFYTKWPKIEKNIIGEVQVKENANKQKIVSYTYDYLVSNDEEEIRGTATQTVTLAKINEDYYIVEETNKNIKSEKTNLRQNPEELEISPRTQAYE